LVAVDETQSLPDGVERPHRDQSEGTRAVNISRRRFTGFSMALGASVALGTGWSSAAKAEDPVDIGKLMEAGPLGDQVLGEDTAPVTIVEYASLTCGHCANFHARTYPELKKRYIDTGKVRFVFREFPLDAPNGPPLATAGFMVARCAPKGAYFDLLSILFEKMPVWAGASNPAEALFTTVKQTGFTQDSFNACLTNQTVLDGVRSVKSRAYSEFGVNSTPTFFINGVMHRGAMTIDEMAAIIDPLLES